MKCESSDGDYTPQVILFTAQFISGIGQPLYYTLGVAYMDDNILKSKTPTFISKLNRIGLKTLRLLIFDIVLSGNVYFSGLAYFMRMLGPALGYTLASMCLKIYVSPSLTPTINNLDPRWLGAWW